jgi:hypothetical protein
MSTNDLVRFVFGVPDKSIDNFNQKITGTPTLDSSTFNLTSGVKRGVGVRYGIAPLPGHNNTETPAANQNNGLQRSEITSGALGLTYRERIYGIVPLTMAPYDGSYPKTTKQYYAYIVGLDYGTDVSLDVCLGSTLESGVYKQASTIVAGLQASSYRQESPLIRLHKTELLNMPLTATPVAADMQAILKGITEKYYIPYAQISVAGKRIPYQWMFGTASSSGNATTAPDVQLWRATLTSRSGYSPTTTPTVYGGLPSEMMTREFTDNNQRQLTVYCLDQYGFGMDLYYTKQITQANTQANPAYDTTLNNYINLTGATKLGASVAYSDVNAAVINDPGSYTNSRHNAILIAGETPIAVVYQDWLKATTGMLPRFVDLTNPGCNPRVGVSTIDPVVVYQPTPKSSSFFDGSNVAVGTSETGILLQDFFYDIGFSYYNKLLDYETNVVYGTTVQSILQNNFSVKLNSITTQYNNIFQDMPNGYSVPWEYSNDIVYPANGPDPESNKGRGFHINDYEIRFYYRQDGVGSWLPVEKFDAAQLWFFNRWESSGGGGYTFSICKSSDISAAIGGEPNGLVQDYSPLPKQRYICTLVFQQRAFWFSETDFRFSLQNNIYAYPLRNVVSSQTGKWRGAIEYSRLDQSNLQGSIIVFADNKTYSGWFTGRVRQQPTQISKDTLAQLDVDGSDFTLDFLCNATAFSYRAAVVAEGIAYWWGPQGIYSYEKGSTPQKISGVLESDIETESIFNYVDMGRDQEVHCVYNKRSSEIIWFYPPKVTDATYPTYGLVLNVETGRFYPFKFRCQIDSAQNISLENDTTPDGIDGERLLLHCREPNTSIQRTYFFDEVAVAGDQGPGQQLSVISISTPATGQRRLTLASGSSGISANNISANDYISFQNVKGYAPALTLASDMIAKIVAVNNGSNYIDIEMPDGGELDATATLTGQTAFPIYHRGFDTIGVNGISYLYQTNYWLVDGLYQSWYWQYLYFLFKYSRIPQPIDPFHPTQGLLSRINLTFESTSGDSQTDVINLINNTKGHCQIHHPLYNQERSANGQALRFALSGIYIGNHWTFEYLEAHCLPEGGFTLKEFEG